MDEVRVHAEPLQPAVSRRGTGDEQVLSSDGRRIDSCEPAFSDSCRTLFSDRPQWAPLCRGHLARPPGDFGNTDRSSAEKGGDNLFQTGTAETDRKIVQRVQELAEKRGWKMSHVALAWINRRVTSPIIGFSSESRMDEALEVRGKELTAEEESYLEELYQPRAISGHF